MRNFMHSWWEYTAYNGEHRLQCSGRVWKSSIFELLLELGLRMWVGKSSDISVSLELVFTLHLLPNLSVRKCSLRLSWTLGSILWTSPTRGPPHWSTCKSVFNLKWDAPHCTASTCNTYFISKPNGALSHEERALQRWAFTTCCLCGMTPKPRNKGVSSGCRQVDSSPGSGPERGLSTLI